MTLLFFITLHAATAGHLMRTQCIQMDTHIAMHAEHSNLMGDVQR